MSDPTDAVAMGDRIRERRKRLDLTGVALAERVGISSSYLSLIENRGRIPSEEVAARLAEALDDDPDLYVAWSRLRDVDDLDEHVRRVSRLREFTTDPRARRRFASGDAVDDLDADDADDLHGEPDDEARGPGRVVPMLRAIHPSDDGDDDADEDDLPPTLEAILHEHYGDEEEPRRGDDTGASVGRVGDRIRRYRRADASDRRLDVRRDAGDRDEAREAPHVPPLGPDTRSVPVLRDGDDPAERPEPLEVLTVDARLLPPGVDQPFAYRPDLRAVHRVRDLIRPGDLVVLTRDPAAFRGRRVHAVRFRGGVVLTRAALKGAMLALLPPPGPSSGFELIELPEVGSRDRTEALGRLVAGTVVATLRWWNAPGGRGPNFAGHGARPPESEAEADAVAELRRRGRDPRPFTRPRSRARSRIASDGALEIACDWHPRYGWRVVHNRADLESAEREAESGRGPGRVRFVLLRDGERRHVLELSAADWRGALGDATRRPGWRRLGQAILSMNRTVSGQPTEELLDRWAPYRR